MLKDGGCIKYKGWKMTFGYRIKEKGETIQY